ncbi:uncharacterized protein LOC123532051 [Mercenaria mercenaria]|uniref:uncharacterized protein LOC123532051 n=1 Tax=Mercenaria mercenaria TaxID=6596 RepID=UPI00234EF1CA|nr:uncharacterized protein LOC123532051 [Mercenaria mercenaria]
MASLTPNWDLINSTIAKMDAATQEGRLLHPYQMFKDLSCLYGLGEDDFKRIVIQQAQIAKNMNQPHRNWLKEARKNASCFFAVQWVNDVFPPFISRKRPAKRKAVSLNNAVPVNPSSSATVDSILRIEPDLIQDSALPNPLTPVRAETVTYTGQTNSENQESVDKGECPMKASEDPQLEILENSGSTVQKPLQITLPDPLPEEAQPEILENSGSTVQANLQVALPDYVAEEPRPEILETSGSTVKANIPVNCTKL